MYNLDSYKEGSFKALFEYANEGIIVTNEHGEIVLANPAIERLFGYDSNELIHQKIEILLPKRIAEKHVALRDSFNKSPHARSMGIGRDLYGVKKNGQEFPVEVSLSPFSIEEGNFVIGFIIDITIRKKFECDIQNQKKELEALTLELEKRVKDRTMILEEALEQLERSRGELSAALEKEKELNEMKSKFVSMASHEFRTPLATILSSLNLLHKYGELNDTANQQRHIHRIKTSITHLTDLLNDVLSISKLEEGKISPIPEIFNIKTFTEQLVQELQELSKKGQQIVFSHKGGMNVFQDPKFLKIILINLISNALKFSPEHSSIEVDILVSNHFINITVKDKGIGISEEDVKHLFERFFRGNNAVNIQGTGLGLNIVARYLELMEGTIQVESQLNQGTSFIISIPNINEHD